MILLLQLIYDTMKSSSSGTSGFDNCLQFFPPELFSGRYLFNKTMRPGLVLQLQIFIFKIQTANGSCSMWSSHSNSYSGPMIISFNFFKPSNFFLDWEKAVLLNGLKFSRSVIFCHIHKNSERNLKCMM